MMVYRDNADYNFQAGQNAEDRAMNTAIASLRAGSGSGKSPGFFDIAAPILGSMLSNWAATAAGGTAIGNVIGRIPIIGNLIK
jgi:hypothetical protein